MSGSQGKGERRKEEWRAEEGERKSERGIDVEEREAEFIEVRVEREQEEAQREGEKDLERKGEATRERSVGRE